MADIVLVTGASGFVGSAVIAALARRDSTTPVAAARRTCPVPPGVRIMSGQDLAHNADWRPALDGVTHVVHCAARVHVMRNEPSDAVEHYRRVNTEGTLSLARQAAAAGVRRFVFLSSVKVHGESTSLSRAFREDDPPDPRGPYAQSKLDAEMGLMRLTEPGMDVVIIRPVLVYGPAVRGNFFSMMRWVWRGLPLPFGLVDNRRSLLALTNLVDLVLTCLDHPSAGNKTFLASDGADISTAELLRKTGVAFGRPARLVPVPPRILSAGGRLVGAGPRIDRLLGSLRVDIGKARTLLGWTPPVSIDDELGRAAAEFRAAERA